MANFVWYDITSNDAAATQAFYCGVMGWTAADAGLKDRSYTIFSQGAMPVAGLAQITPAMDATGAIERWRGHIGVDNVDAYSARVEAAGGTIQRMPQDIPDVGRFAVIADPHGAMCILFSSVNTEQRPHTAAPGAPGHIGWHELHAGDRESAFAFYSGLFGWTDGGTHDMGPMGIYQMFATREVPVGGMMTKTPDMQAATWLYYFNVERVDAAVERVKRHGGTILLEPHEVPGGSWITQCLDSQGAMFALVGAER